MLKDSKSSSPSATAKASPRSVSATSGSRLRPPASQGTRRVRSRGDESRQDAHLVADPDEVAEPHGDQLRAPVAIGAHVAVEVDKPVEVGPRSPSSWGARRSPPADNVVGQSAPTPAIWRCRSRELRRVVGTTGRSRREMIVGSGPSHHETMCSRANPHDRGQRHAGGWRSRQPCSSPCTVQVQEREHGAGVAIAAGSAVFVHDPDHSCHGFRDWEEAASRGESRLRGPPAPLGGGGRLNGYPSTSPRRVQRADDPRSPTTHRQTPVSRWPDTGMAIPSHQPHRRILWQPTTL